MKQPIMYCEVCNLVHRDVDKHKCAPKKVVLQPGDKCPPKWTFEEVDGDLTCEIYALSFQDAANFAMGWMHTTFNYNYYKMTEARFLLTRHSDGKVELWECMAAPLSVYKSIFVEDFHGEDSEGKRAALRFINRVRRWYKGETE